MAKKQKEEVPIPSVELKPEVELSIRNTESVVGGVYSDLDELGNMIETMSNTAEDTSKAVKALVKQYIKDRKEQEKFNREITVIISNEVAKQIEPLAKQINSLVKNKPKFVWVLPSFPKLGLWTKIKSKFIRVKEVK